MDYRDKKLNYILKKVDNVNMAYNIEENDILWLCTQVEKILANEPTVLFLEAPITVVGDIHGKLDDLNYVLELGGSIVEENRKYLFLGDYIDRGDNSVEVIVKLLVLKIKYPENVYLLRGNHESDMINEKGSLKEQITEKRLGNSWYSLTNVFRELSLAAVINNRIFCVHAGLSPELQSIDQLSSIRKPIDIPSEGIVRDILWADPTDRSGFEFNEERQTSVVYGPDVSMEFLKRHRFQLLVRAHQVCDDGYEFPFHGNNCVVTVYSSDAGDNNCAIMKVAKDLGITFERFRLKSALEDV